MAHFILFNKELSIPDSYIRNYKMNENSYTAAMSAKDEFYAWYKKCSDIEDVLKNYSEIAISMVEKYAFAPLFNSLHAYEIYDISADSYISQCVDCRDIDNSFEMILSELEKIIDDQNEMKQYRAARKAYRGRMVGGGFGLSGAIKGAVKAGAINATTGMAHSAVNAIGNMGSSIAASSNKSSLYKNNHTKEVLAKGICLSILNTYQNHKQLINRYCECYFANGFDEDKGNALFENAIRFSDKREMLLVESVVNYPNENTLAYIFRNYRSERKNVYVIGEAFGLDFGKYVEEAFAALYTDEIKLSAQKAEAIKKDILATMKEFGINSSATLNQINYDELIRIAKKYISATTAEENIQQYLADFVEYEAPLRQKEVVEEMGIWQLASKYEVVFSDDAIECILRRYYTDEAIKNEEEAQKCKEKIIDIMSVLGIQTSKTFDCLEKDCIARLCENISEADEVTCNRMRDNVMNYDALEKNKKEFLNKIQKRIEDIWTKEDGEIFDNVYLNTDIHNQNEINCSIEFIKQKGRTSNADRYVAALQACNEKNIQDARKFQEKGTRTNKTVGIVLLLAGILCWFCVRPLSVISIPGLILMLKYNKLKKNWNVLTLNGTQIHSAIKIDSPNVQNGHAMLSDKEATINFARNKKNKVVCSSCGKEINSSASFCIHCGKKIEK